MGSLCHVQVYVVFADDPENRNAPLVIDMVPDAPDVVSVATHWSPVNVEVLDPESSEKFSEKTVVWAWVVGAMPINATRAIRPRIPPKERRAETRSGVATARD